jgi:hypothetical protein
MLNQAGLAFRQLPHHPFKKLKRAAFPYEEVRLLIKLLDGLGCTRVFRMGRARFVMFSAI